MLETSYQDIIGLKNRGFTEIQINELKRYLKDKWAVFSNGEPFPITD